MRGFEEHLQDAVAKGARIILGGSRHALGGTFFQPTVSREGSRHGILEYKEMRYVCVGL